MFRNKFLRKAKALIAAILVIAMTVGELPALAVGIGTPGSNNVPASSLPANAVLPYADSRDIVGYRFTVYDKSTGNIVAGSHSADIIMSHYPYVRLPFYGYSIAGADNEPYRLVDKVSLSESEKSTDSSSKKRYTTGVGMRRVTYNSSARTFVTEYRPSDSDNWLPMDVAGSTHTYYWDAIKDNTDVYRWYRQSDFTYNTSVFWQSSANGAYAGWLGVNEKQEDLVLYGYYREDNVYGVKKCCGLTESAMDPEQYIFVEPIFAAKSDGNTYIMTMSEFALFQCDAIQSFYAQNGQENANGWSVSVKNPAGTQSSDWFAWIAPYICGYHPSLLYVLQKDVTANNAGGGNLWGKISPVQLDKTGDASWYQANALYTGATAIGIKNGTTAFVGYNSRIVDSTQGRRFSYNTAQALIETTVGVGIYYGQQDAVGTNITLDVHLDAEGNDYSNYTSFISNEGISELWLSKAGQPNIYFNVTGDGQYHFMSSTSISDISDLNGWELYYDGGSTGNIYDISPSGHIVVNYYSVTYKSDALSYIGWTSSSINRQNATLTQIVLEGTEIRFYAKPFNNGARVLYTDASATYGASSVAAPRLGDAHVVGSYTYKSKAIWSRTVVNVSGTQGASTVLYIVPHLDSTAADRTQLKILHEDYDPVDQANYGPSVNPDDIWDGLSMYIGIEFFDDNIWGAYKVRLSDYWDAGLGCCIINGREAGQLGNLFFDASNAYSNYNESEWTLYNASMDNASSDKVMCTYVTDTSGNVTIHLYYYSYTVRAAEGIESVRFSSTDAEAEVTEDTIIVAGGFVPQCDVVGSVIFRDTLPQSRAVMGNLLIYSCADFTNDRFDFGAHNAAVNQKTITEIYAFGAKISVGTKINDVPAYCSDFDLYVYIEGGGIFRPEPGSPKIELYLPVGTYFYVSYKRSDATSECIEYREYYQIWAGGDAQQLSNAYQHSIADFGSLEQLDDGSNEMWLEYYTATVDSDINIECATVNVKDCSIGWKSDGNGTAPQPDYITVISSKDVLMDGSRVDRYVDIIHSEDGLLAEMATRFTEVEFNATVRDPYTIPYPVGSLRVHVVRGTSGVSGVEVIINGGTFSDSAVTDADGYVTFTELPARRYDVVLNGEGVGDYISAGSVTVQPGTATITPSFSGWTGTTISAYKNISKGVNGAIYEFARAEKREVPSIPLTEFEYTASTSYTVEYYLDGVKLDSLTQTCVYGTSYNYADLPTKTGYTVSGWYGTSDYTGAIYAGNSSFSNLTNVNGGVIKRYAKSEPFSYTVEYYLDGERLLDLTQTCVYGTTYNYVSLPAKEGYTVSGWYYSSSCTGSRYNAGDAFRNLTTVNGGVVRRYAKSEAAAGTKYTVNHYLQPIGGGNSGFTLALTQELYGASGDKITVNDLAETFDGFTYLGGYARTLTTSSTVPGKFTISTTVLANGLRVIDMYYTRNTYTVTLDGDEGIASTSGEGEYYFGESVAIDAVVKAPTSSSGVYNFGVASVTATKSGVGYAGLDVDLYQGGVKKYDLTTYVNGVYSGTVASGTYNVYVGGANTGITITVSAGTTVTTTSYIWKEWTGDMPSMVKQYAFDMPAQDVANCATTVKNITTENTPGSGNATLAYYVVALDGDEGISSTSGAGTYLNGVSVTINATVKSPSTATSTYNFGVASVTVQKNGTAYASRDVDLYQSGVKKYDLTTYSAGVYSGVVASGTYRIYVDGVDTGVNITVSAGTTTTTTSYTWKEWTGDKPSTTKQYSFIIASDVTNHATTTKSVSSTNVNGSGAATVNYYTLSINKDDGISSVSGAGVYLSGTSVSISATAKTGYLFKSWTVNEGCTPASTASASTAVTITAKTTLTATSKAASGVTYVVNHYQENLTKTGYTLFATENFAGTTGDVITISTLAKNYTGFTFEGGKGTTAASAIKPATFDTTTTVLADGTRVINMYYARNTYTVTVVASPDGYGSVSKSSITAIPYGTPISVSGNVLTVSKATAETSTATPAAATAQYTYSFVNWTGVPSTVTADITVTANFTRTANNYILTINYYEKDTTNKVATSYVGTYAYGATYSVASPSVTGFNLVNSAQSTVSGTMPAANTTINVYYTRISYTVTYLGNGHTGGSTASQTKYHDIDLTLRNNGFIKTGYTFIGWNTAADGSGTAYSESGLYTVNASLTLYAQWTASATSYVVNHYLENATKTGYVLDSSSTKAGVSGATITIASLAGSYTGFAFEGGKGTTAASATKPATFDTTTTVLADGTRVVNLYYSRNNYTLTVQTTVDGINKQPFSTAKVVINGTSYNVPSTGTVTVTLPYNATYTVLVMEKSSSACDHSFATGTITGNATVTVPYFTATAVSGSYISSATVDSTASVVVLSGTSVSFAATVAGNPANSVVAYPYGIATITVKKDGAGWASRSVELKNGSTVVASGTTNASGVFTSGVIASGTYDVYVGGVKVGTVTVSNGISTTSYANAWDKWTGTTNNANQTFAYTVVATTTETANGKQTPSTVNSNGSGATTIEYKTLPAFPSLDDESKSITLTLNKGANIASVSPASKTCTQTRTRAYTKYYTTSAKNVVLGVPGDVVLASAYTVEYPGAITYGAWTPASHSDSISASLPANVLSNTVAITVKLDGSAYASRTVHLSTSPTSDTASYSSPSYNGGVYTFTGVASGSTSTTYYVWIDGVYVGQSVVVKPAETYAFEKWTVNSGDTPASTTVASTTVNHTQDTVLTASATKTTNASASATVNYYTLTLNKGTGIASVSGAGVYLSGTTVSISASVSTGYSFGSWTRNAGNSPANASVASTTVTITSTTTLTANAATNLYTVILDGDEGILSTSGAGTYPYGSSVTIDATVKPASAVNTPYNFGVASVTVNKGGVAYAGLDVDLYQSGSKKYDLTTYSAGVYSGTVASGTYDVYVGGVDTGVDITVSAGTTTTTTSYTWKEWTGDKPSTTKQYTFTLTGNVTNYATTTKSVTSTNANGSGAATVNYYTLTINYYEKDTTNKLAASYVGTYIYGSTYSVVSPEIAGFVLVNTAQSTVIGTIPAANTTINVYYKRNEFIVILDHDDNFTSVSGAGTYTVGDTVNISALLKDTEYLSADCGVHLYLNNTLWSGQQVVFISSANVRYITTETATGYYSAILPYSEYAYKIEVNGILVSTKIYSDAYRKYEFMKWVYTATDGIAYTDINSSFTMPAENVSLKAIGNNTVKRVNGAVVIDPDVKFYIVEAIAGQYITDAGVRKEGEENYHSSVKVPEGTVVEFTATVAPNPANTISAYGYGTATITLNKDGAGWASQTVELKSGSTLVASGTTNASGDYTSSAIASGIYDVYVGGAKVGSVTVSNGTSTTSYANSWDKWTGTVDNANRLFSYTVTCNMTETALGSQTPSTVNTLGTGSATFNYYTLTLIKGTGIADVGGAGVYLSGTTVSISATTSTGYVFDGWTCNVGNSPANASAASTTVTITSTTTLSAKATRNKVTIIVRNDDVSYIGYTGTITLVSGGVTISTTPTDNEYTLETTLPIANGTYTVYADGVSTGVIVVVNNNEPVAYVDYYTVTTIAESGIASTSGDGVYLKGTTATIDAIAESECWFWKWTGTHNNSIKQYSFTVTQKVVDTAHAQTNYYVNYYVENKHGGNTLMATDTFVGEPGTTVTVTPERSFAGFRGKSTVVSNPSATKTGVITTTAIVSVGGTMHVDYYFEREQITITYVLNGGTFNGSTANVVRTYDVGTTITLITPVAPTGKIFSGWYLNQDGTNFSGCIGGAGDQYLLTKSITVYACYSTPYDIGITANTIYGTIHKDSSFTSSATILNHSFADLLPSMKVKAIAKVYNGSTLIATYTAYNSDGSEYIVSPALKRNLVYVSISTAGWSASGNYKVEWSLDFSEATFADRDSTNNQSTIVSIVPGSGVAYGNTARPGYELTPPGTYSPVRDADMPKTSVNRHNWEVWTYESGSFKKTSYSDQLSATLILKPENENGLRTYTLGEYNIHNYTTRSGYGFSIHTSFSDLELATKRSNVSASYVKAGKVYGYMTYPEFNYEAASEKCTSLIFASSGGSYLMTMPAYSDYETGDPNDKYAHYTPMWLPDGKYKPVTYIRGLWSPMGELTLTIVQGELTTKAAMDKYKVYTNEYIIDGSLYDDIYN